MHGMKSQPRCLERQGFLRGAKKHTKYTIEYGEGDICVAAYGTSTGIAVICLIQGFIFVHHKSQRPQSVLSTSSSGAMTSLIFFLTTSDGSS